MLTGLQGIRTRVAPTQRIVCPCYSRGLHATGWSSLACNWLGQPTRLTQQFLNSKPSNHCGIAFCLLYGMCPCFKSLWHSILPALWNAVRHTGTKTKGVQSKSSPAYQARQLRGLSKIALHIIYIEALYIWASRHRCKCIFQSFGCLHGEKETKRRAWLDSIALNSHFLFDLQSFL